MIKTIVILSSLLALLGLFIAFYMRLSIGFFITVAAIVTLIYFLISKK